MIKTLKVHGMIWYYKLNIYLLMKKSVPPLLLFSAFALALPAQSQSISSIIQKSVGIIEGPGSDGSGFVIGVKGDQYVGLTAAHVVSCKTIPKEEHNIYFPSLGGKKYRINSCDTPNPKLDIAIITFKSSTPIQVLPYATNYQELFDKGYSKGDFNSTADAGRVNGYSLPTKAITSPIYRSIHFQFLPLQKNNLEGYNVLYPASTVPGMSGGPVIGIYPCAGNGFYPRAIAVHGRSEDYMYGGRSGLSLGVPIALIAKSKIKNLPTSSSANLCTNDPWN